MKVVFEVTPDMIRAGLHHLSQYHREWGEDAEETVEAIFRAMVAASERDAAHTAGRAEMREEAIAAQPSLPVDPDESEHWKWFFEGVAAYGRAIVALPTGRYHLD